MKLNIYDQTGKNVERVAEGEMYDIMFGTIENIIDILNLDDASSDTDILKKIYAAYKDLRVILSGFFCDISEDEWKRVKVKELLPVVLEIIRFTFLQMKELPTEKN